MTVVCESRLRRQGPRWKCVSQRNPPVNRRHRVYGSHSVKTVSGKVKVQHHILPIQTTHSSRTRPHSSLVLGPCALCPHSALPTTDSFGVPSYHRPSVTLICVYATRFRTVPKSLWILHAYSGVSRIVSVSQLELFAFNCKITNHVMYRWAL